MTRFGAFLAPWGRAYFGVQAIAVGAWWVMVFTVPAVRQATLGTLDPVVVAALDLPLFVLASALAVSGVRLVERIAAGVAAVWTSIVAVALAVFATVTTEAGWGVLVMIAAAGCSVLALCAVRFGRIPTGWIVQGPFAFRVADPGRGAASNRRRTFAQIVVFWGLFLGVIPLVIVTLEQRWAVGIPHLGAPWVLGLVLLVAASALGIRSAWVMSTLGSGTPLPSAMPNHLVVAGPYRWVRNPMALAGIAQGMAVGLILGSWLVVVYAVVGAVVWNAVIRPHEEADLERRFGEEFRRYRRAVRCWLPNRAPVPASACRAR